MTGSHDLDTFLAVLRKEYLQDLPEKIGLIESVLLAHEQSHKQLDTRILREVHSIKGTAGTFAFTIASTICHQFEDDLEGFVQKGGVGNPAEIERLLKYVDFLRQALMIALEPATPEDERERQWQLILPKLRSLAGVEKTKVFVVDNSRITFGIIQRGMADSQVAISYSGDGYEALGRLLREDFDLVVVGKSVRGLNGPSLIAATRMNRPKAPPFLMLSSDAYIPKLVYDAPDALVLRDEHLVKNLSATALSMVDSR